jgi:glycosyltransferase involved in cell wall biosynthesis
VAAVGEVRDEWAKNHPEVYLAEVVLVDDASKDNSSEVMARLAAKHPWVEAITLSKSFGRRTRGADGQPRRGRRPSAWWPGLGRAADGER